MFNISNYEIQLISPKDTYSVRQPILRTGKPIETCVFDGDELETTFHLGLFIENNLTAVASFMKQSNTLLSEKNQYQLRGMAVLTSCQGKGLGYHILKHGETMLLKKGVKTVWCNAREIAVNFYEKSNYCIIGDSFDIPEIGKHYVMYKHL